MSKHAEPVPLVTHAVTGYRPTHRDDTVPVDAPSRSNKRIGGVR
jgi:hypothetical protein